MTDVRTDPNYRKASLLKIISILELLQGSTWKELKDQWTGTFIHFQSFEKHVPLFLLSKSVPKLSYQQF